MLHAGGLDPTHFRNILNNVQLIHGARITFVEVQVHHAAILLYNDRSHAHYHYEFFRALLGETYNKELDATLERAVLFFEEARGTPVLWLRLFIRGHMAPQRGVASSCAVWIME